MLPLLRKRISPGEVYRFKYTLSSFQHLLPHFLLQYIPGHYINKPNVILVLNVVKDFKKLAKAIKMPEDLTDSKKEENVEKILSFWLDTGQSWNTLEHVLTQCQEHASARCALLMKQYNRKGTYLLYFLFSLLMTCMTSYCRCSSNYCTCV